MTGLSEADPPRSWPAATAALTIVVLPLLDAPTSPPPPLFRSDEQPYPTGLVSIPPVDALHVAARYDIEDDEVIGETACRLLPPHAVPARSG